MRSWLAASLLGVLLVISSSCPASSSPQEPAAGQLPVVELLSADESRVDLLFELTDYKVEELTVGEELFHLVTIPGGAHAGAVGAPAVPTFTRLVAIPDDAGVTISVVPEQEEERPGFQLLPVQADEGDGFAYDPVAYARDGFGQAGRASVGRPAILRDLRVVPLTFRPIAYDPARGVLRVTRRMRVEVTFAGRDEENAKRRHRRTVAPSFDRLYRNAVVNYTEQLRGEAVAPGTYLLICPDNSTVVNLLQPLVEWRQRKGTPVYLATTSETGSSNSSIKNFIQNAYDTWEIPPEYVTLVGDASGTYVIPTWYENYTNYHGEGDHPYTQLEGGDVLADIHIGRLSIGSTSELEMIVAKMVGYESTPYLSDPGWYTRACLTGDPYQSGYSCVEVQRWIKTRLLQLGYTEIDTIFQDPFVTNMRTALNRGDTIFSYRGYYGMSGWSNTNTSQLTNGWKMPFCVIITCDTGSFASGTSRTEQFLRVGTPPNSPKGGIGAIGTATTHTHTRYNNCMHYGIFRGLLWEDQYEMGAAFTRGKLELWLNYNGMEDTEIGTFSHWNNLMGDSAGEVWTGYPESMSVTHPTSVHVGANAVTVSVEDDASAPIEGAQVCLWKGDQTYVVGYTDATGAVELPVSNTTTGTMLLTVTRHNSHPYLANISVTSGGAYVGYDASTIDDDNVDTSVGNGNGIINPGETIELPVRLKNFGSVSASNVTGTLTTAEPYVTILDDAESFGNIAAGGTAWSADDFDFSVAPGCQHGRTLRFGLDVSSGANQWHSLIELDVVSADLVTDATTLYGSGNGILDPGETVELSVKLRNNGGANASFVFGTLSSLSPFVSVNDGSGSFGTIAVGGTGENTTDRFSISADPGTYEGHLANLMLALQFSGTALDTTFVLLTVGQRASDDPVGPDRYGYYCFDDTDVGYSHAPTYSWVEIDPSYGGDGTDTGLNDTYDYGDQSVVVDLPFPFQYYGTVYDRATICSNGWIAMGETYLTTYRNWTIPGAGGPDAMLAVFWDDLYQTSGSRVCQKYDAANHRWIVEWSRMRNDYNGQPETFEAILLDPAHHPTETGDGEIIFQYNDVYVYDPVDAHTTVGIESPDQSDGVLYTFFNVYPAGAASLVDGRAIRFIPLPVGERGTLQGEVVNASYGDVPISGAQVVLLENGRMFTTGPDGTYGGMVSVGTYTAVAQHPSFEPDTAYGVLIESSQTTTLDFSLTDIGGPIITTTTHPSTGDTLGPYLIPVTIVEFSGLAAKSLFYRVDGGDFSEVELESLGGDSYRGSIPGQGFGSTVHYYIYARDELGFESFDPPGAPDEFFSFDVVQTTVLLDDDFETDQGWTVGAAGDDATTGIWVRAEPVGTQTGGNQVQPEYDHTPDPGQICYVTGNDTPGDPAGDNDVDGGKTTLLSPVFDLSGYNSATLVYWVWYTTSFGGDPGNDYWDVDVTGDGSSWVHLEHTTQSTNAWVERTFELDEVIEFTDQVRFRFVASDEGSGSLVEAAVDDFTLTARYEIIDVESQGAVLLASGLDVCHPNPFNPMTTITYRVANTGPVTLRLYDLGGRLVRTLVDDVVAFGPHEVRWDGRDDLGQVVASGVYFMRLETPGFMQVRQMTLLR